MNREYNIDELVNDIDFSINNINDYGNGIILTNGEVDVLNKYKIDFKNCFDLKELIYKIEDYLDSNDDCDIDDLDNISLSISERDYYINTNK